MNDDFPDSGDATEVSDLGFEESELVDEYGRTEVASGDLLDQFGQDTEVVRTDFGADATDRAPGSILRKGDHATMDFGLQVEPTGLEEASVSETSVAPITADDLDATAIGDAIDGRFRLLGVLGEGGMGRVYRGVQISINRDVAIKVVLEEFAQDEELRQRFLREAQLISGFNHPNIVGLIDFGETEGRLYLAMEFVNGRPLNELFRKKRLHPRFALEICLQITSALTEAHAKGVVHRDLKPENVLLTRIADGTAQCKVLDFGVASTSTSNLTAAGTVCGTPDYMAPEQARGHKVTGATDLYSVGAILFEFLTGRLPFEAESPVKMMIMHVNQEPPRVRDLVPEVPEAIDELVASLMKKDAEERIDSATYLCERIEKILNEFGWGSKVRLPNGSLAETTKAWHWKDGQPIEPQRSTQQKPQVSSTKPAPSQEVSDGDDWFSSTEHEAIDDHNQSEFSPDASFSLDSTDPKPEPTRTPEPGSQAPEAADRQFDDIELDLPQENPDPPAPRNTPAPAQSPRTQQPARPHAMTSQSRTSPSHQATGDQRSTVALLAVLIVLLMASAGVAYWIFVIKDQNVDEPPAIGAVQATGEPGRVFAHFESNGWTRTGDFSTQDIGSIQSTSQRFSQSGHLLLVEVYNTPTEADVRTIFKTRAFAPRKGFHYKDTVVVVEALDDTSPIYAQVGVDLLETLEPDGIDSITRL